MKTNGSPKVPPHVLAVVGGQYGSEGKGVVVHHLRDRYDVHVRVGGPNAGHSFYHRDTLWKMQVVPCGWTNPNALLVLGRGMVVDAHTLTAEIEAIRRHDPSIVYRLIIDAKAGVLSRDHHAYEGGVEGELHHRIGSTGEGVGAARVARLQRDREKFCHIMDIAHDVGTSEWSLDQMIAFNTPAILKDRLNSDQSILLEGTQGFGLSLIHGNWPFVTSADISAAQLAADVGISPRLVTRVLMVVRSHPIRVAGNSGPMYNEISWAEMSRRLGRTVEEKTTVTKKTRRIGEWDDQLFSDAVTVNHPSSLALMFADYLEPSDESKLQFEELSDRTRRFVSYLESMASAPVALIGTGGLRWNVIDRGMRL